MVIYDYIRLKIKKFGGSMKLHNTFKIIWWVLLLVGLLSLIYKRFNHIISNQVLPFDYIIFTVCIVLACLPFFSEMNMFGFKLKKEIEEVKNNVESGINQIKSLINNINNSNNIYFNPLDSYLGGKQLEAIEKKLNVKGSKPTVHPETIADKYLKDEHVKSLFAIRYAIEQEVRRIYNSTFGPVDNKYKFFEAAELLEAYGFIDESTKLAIRENFKITSLAIHGEKVTKNQIDFVLLTGTKIIKDLSEIE